MNISSIASSYYNNSLIAELSSTTSTDYSELFDSSGVSSNEYESIYNVINEEYDLAFTDFSDEEELDSILTDLPSLAEIFASMQSNLISSFYDYSDDETGLMSLLSEYNLSRIQSLKELYQSLYSDSTTEESSNAGSILNILA
ncbi:hypothetical protein Q5O24_05585 [Eubacteriaceae bacterium ES3]|nr:hypothetical protein Q5O24_05585 [Eubacteriaceae bacterium ES3]